MSEQPTYAQRIIQAQAKELGDRAALQVTRVLPIGWPDALPAARLAVAEALSCLLEDAAFYGEDAISVYRVRRIKEQLNPGDTSVGADT